ncbi:AlbA family DNA-binding domain-containing protein [Mycolicibacterium elephantis]|uniref:AlbA family DNA-binding domain-containing protein n=1 Tax=Mycolicibacterium elephantis TaxID=81858 RepID=UPI000A872177|nr:hypothetical protein [Mycolicibacterium elephantis]
MSKRAPQIKSRAIEPLRFKGVSKAARELLAASGETERFEFKRDASAVKKVLVAAANWVALDPATREKVTLLVGVDEEKGPGTGLVTGKIVGLSDLDKSIDAIQQYCASTRPVSCRASNYRREHGHIETVSAS